MGHVRIYSGILLEFWFECWWLILLAKSVPTIEHLAQILQNIYNTKKTSEYIKFSPPHASPLISLTSYLIKCIPDSCMCMHFTRW